MKENRLYLKSVSDSEKEKIGDAMNMMVNDDEPPTGQRTNVALASRLAQMGVGLNTIYIRNVELIKLPQSTDAQKRVLGKWSGERGASDWLPNDEIIPGQHNPMGLTWSDIKEIYCFSGIPFYRMSPDFSVVAKGRVVIDGFSKDRATNFKKADTALAEQQTDIGCTDSQVRCWRTENHYTWHECNDCMTMLLVPSIIHGNVNHTGGIGMERGILAMNETLKERLGGRDFVLSQKSFSGTIDRKEFERVLNAHRRKVRKVRKKI